SSASDFLRLLVPVCANSHTCADCVAIRPRSDQLQKQPFLMCPVILQQARRVVAVVDHNFKGPVIVKIRRGCPVAIERRCDPFPGSQRDVLEPPVPLVPIHYFSLSKARAEVPSVNLWVNVPVRKKNVWPSVIVDVHE